MMALRVLKREERDIYIPIVCVVIVIKLGYCFVLVTQGLFILYTT